MSKYTFLFKEKNNDRDCVNYIEIGSLGKLECGHYFSSINLIGACFSSSFKLDEIDFDNIESILTKEEFEKLSAYNDKINELGYGIIKNDDRYLKGKELYKDIEGIFNKLLSKENESLFEKVKKDEKEYVKNRWNLSDVDVGYIFNNYTLSFQDRGIISCVFNDIEEASHEEAFQLGMVNDLNKECFDYDSLGIDMLKNKERYLELPSKKIARMNY